MKNCLCIYHLSAIELFPPVLNLIDFISANTTSKNKIFIFTSIPPLGVAKYCSQASHIIIIRRGKINGLVSGSKRAFALICYNIAGIIDLIVKNPNSVLYYETNSSLPVIICKKLLGRKFKLFIHYHEYMTSADYLRSRFQYRLHKFERSFYKSANWISHTNEIRMQLFLHDIGMPELINTRILHNYPSSSWAGNLSKLKPPIPPVKFVFVGSFSFTNTYIKEFIIWLDNLNSFANLDIFTQSDTTELIEFLVNYPKGLVSVKGFVDYNKLPEFLKNYHIGLILYKGMERNVSLSEPNKLFEYLACGLDVWIDKAIIGAKAYYTDGVYPKVIGLEYSELRSFDLNSALDRANCEFKKPSNFYESEYQEFLKSLMNLNNTN